jgi:hypothetical protein
MEEKMRIERKKTHTHTHKHLLKNVLGLSEGDFCN